MLCHPDSYRESYEIIFLSYHPFLKGSAKISPRCLRSKKFLIVVRAIPSGKCTGCLASFNICAFSFRFAFSIAISCQIFSIIKWWLLQAAVKA